MRKAGVSFWAMGILISCLIIALKSTSGLPLETNILALLPKPSEEARWVQMGKELMNEKVTGHILAIVSHSDLNKAHQAADKLFTALKDKNFIASSVESTNKLSPELIGEVLFPFRLGLLSAKDLALLHNGAVDRISEQAQAQISSPLGLVSSSLIRNDPYLLFPRYLSELQDAQSKTGVINGYPFIKNKNRFYIIVSMKLGGDPFSQSFQEIFVPYFKQTAAKVMLEVSDLEIIKSGAIFYAEQAASDAQGEATLIGLISLVAILALTFLVFRDMQPIGLSLLAISVGILGGAAAILIFYEKIHLFSLIFGAGLMGVSVDYAFHYCCQRFSHIPSVTRLNSILRGLTLGLISSVVGFLMLVWAPFPGLRQIAVFSATGLTMSYTTVVLIFPLLDKAKNLDMNDEILMLIKFHYNFWDRRDLSFARWVGGAILLGLFIMGFTNFKAEDDIRKLQSLPDNLRKEELVIRKLTGRHDATQFFLISGSTQEEVLIREEALALELERLVGKHALSGYLSVSSFVPSIKQQKENRVLARELLLGMNLKKHLENMGANPQFGYDEHELNYLSPELVRDRSIFPFIDFLQLARDNQNFIHLLSLRGVNDVGALSSLADKFSKVKFVDPTQDISLILADYRIRALSLFSIACLLIFCFMSFFYGTKGAFRVMTPPLIAVVVTPFVIAAFGGIFTFFSAMALILVFALGMDYSLFCAESLKSHMNISLLANGLSALSTIFAFGMLALSEMYAVHSFGATILVGIVLAFGLAPIARKHQQEISC